MTAWLDQFFAEKMIQRFGGASVPFLIELMKESREGHLCIQRQDPVESPAGMIYEATIETPMFPEAPIIKRGQNYYLQRNWVYETHICRQISRLLSAPKSSSSDPSALLNGAPLLPAQAKAIQHALESPLTVISGGPGTGKTYTAGHLIQILAKTSDVKRLYKVCLTAPTGKAAQHLQSSLCINDLPISLRVETLHRLLNLAPGRSKLFQPVPIDADLIIVDEASMIDVDLWAHLLEAVSSRTKLVLMGDPDQLPPIEAGSIFSDLSDLFAVRLDRCMRTDETKLRELSLAIQEGSLEKIKQLLESGLGTFCIFDPLNLYEKLSLPLFSEPPDPKACLDHFQQFKILNALRQGPLGIDALNQTFLRLYQKTFRTNLFWAAPILIAANAPEIDLYNGTAGVLIGPCQKPFSLTEAKAYFQDPLSGQMRSFSPQALPHYEWAFCLSVHKSQGSEFDHVLALFPEGSERFGRESLYTAATRAKKSFHMISEQKVLENLLARRSRKRSGVVEYFRTKMQSTVMHDEPQT